MLFRSPDIDCKKNANGSNIYRTLSVDLSERIGNEDGKADSEDEPSGGL